MLRADKIELALLNLIVDWNTPVGPTYRLHQYREVASMAVDAVSDREIVDSLLVLYEDDIISIGQYVGSTFVNYDPANATDYFYRSAFRCTARPKARRRQQALARGNRHGVFISHIGDEKPIALRIQELIERTLSPMVPVFVSSDYRSIESGEEWYRAILDGLRRSQVVIVLLSNESVDRRWINFEAGFGLGQESKVVPVVWRGLSKGDIGFPLSQLQARDLGDREDVEALINSIGTICHAKVQEHSAEDFLRDIASLQGTIPSTGLEATPFLKDNALWLAVQNSGNRLLEMIDAELQVPAELQGNALIQAQSPVREVSRYSENGISWAGHRLTTIPSTRPHLGIEPLRAQLVKGVGEIILAGLTVPLPRSIPDEYWKLPIRYRVSSRQMTVGPIVVPLSRVPKR